MSKDTIRSAIRLLVRLHLLMPSDHVNGNRIFYTITHPREWNTLEEDHTPVQDGGVPQGSTEASLREVHNNKETINNTKKSNFFKDDQGKKVSFIGSKENSNTENQELKQAEQCSNVPLPTHIFVGLDEILNANKTERMNEI